MGAAHSRKTSESQEQGAHTEIHPSAKRDNSKKALAPIRSDGHVACDNDLSPLGPAKTTRRITIQEEGKLSVNFSESDLKQMMQSIGNMDRRHYHRASHAAVHPIEQQYEQHSSHTVPIESLPPPAHEVKKSLRGSSSLPVRCPSRSSRPTDDTLSSFSEDGDSEYLSKLYDLRTWNMYRLITEARRQRQIDYQPNSILEEKSNEQGQDCLVEDQEDSSSFTMIFAIDVE
jgi:hypothetical protein